jgi:hypothetical protein
MTVVLILVAIALLALLFLIRSARRRALVPGSWEQVRAQLRPVDLEAFRNLVDPDEEQFLRGSLPGPEFRAIQRERCLAALAYISCAAHNASLLARLGEAARRNPDPSLAEAGAKLVDSAVRLRVFAFQARTKLYFTVVLPASTRISPAELTESYERLTRQGFILGRIQSGSTRASVPA